MPTSTPTFESAPVVEVVLGVQFEPIGDFSNAHLGAFWLSVGVDMWERPTDVMPIPQQFERFGTERSWMMSNTFGIGITPIPASLLRLTNKAGDRLIQIQNGRLLYNWVAKDGGEYPRYDQIRGEFDAITKQLHDFLQQQKLGDIQANQWEVTYVNTMPRGSGWEQPSDWGKIFSTNAMLPEQVNECRLESVSGQWVYEIEPAQGRLHVLIQSGRRIETTEEILTLTLTARGPVTPERNLSEGVNLGHTVIVNSFRDLASAESRHHWKEIK